MTAGKGGRIPFVKDNVLLNVRNIHFKIYKNVFISKTRLLLPLSIRIDLTFLIYRMVFLF